MPPSSGLALDEMNDESASRQLEGGRHPGRAAAEDERRRHDRDLGRVQRLERARPTGGHAHQGLGLLRRRLPIVRVHPRTLVADVGHLEQGRVEAGGAQAVLEQRLMRARGARGDHDPVQPKVFDLLRDMGDASPASRCTDCARRGRRRAGCGRIRPCPGRRGSRRCSIRSDRRTRRRAALRPATSRSGGYSAMARQRAAGRRQQPGGAGRGGAGLDDRLGDVLRLAERAGGEDARRGDGLHRLEQRGVAEAVLVQLDAQIGGPGRAPTRTSPCRPRGRPGRRLLSDQCVVVQ